MAGKPRKKKNVPATFLRASDALLFDKVVVFTSRVDVGKYQTPPKSADEQANEWLEHKQGDIQVVRIEHAYCPAPTAFGKLFVGSILSVMVHYRE
jgi:hypothetical protein